MKLDSADLISLVLQECFHSLRLVLASLTVSSFFLVSSLAWAKMMSVPGELFFYK